MTDWQPIETAPKDGTSVLVYGPWKGEFSQLKHPHEIWRGHCHPVSKLWFISGTLEFVDPTHWMPLPEPPK
jgi:hypothetical protein